MSENTHKVDFVRLGPIPKVKLEGKRFLPKQKTKLKYYHPPPSNFSTIIIQGYTSSLKQCIILALTNKSIAMKKSPPYPPLSSNKSLISGFTVKTQVFRLVCSHVEIDKLQDFI